MKEEKDNSEQNSSSPGIINNLPNYLAKNNSNKTVSIHLIIALSGRQFIAHKIIKELNYIEFFGYEMRNQEYIDKITNYDELIEFVKEHQINQINITYPYNSLECIENITFKIKNK